MKIIIIDEEEQAAKFLREDILMLRKELEVVDTFTDFSAFVQYLKRNDEPDLLLLDIVQLNRKALTYLRSGSFSSPVLFTNSLKNTFQRGKGGDMAHSLTAEDDLTGLPTDSLDLVKTLAERLTNGKNGIGVPGSSCYQSRFLVRNKQKFISIKTADVGIFFAEGRLNFLKTKDNRKFICHNTIETLHDSLLDPQYFFRVNRSTIISFDDIKDIFPYFGGRLKLVLNTPFEKEIIVSRDRVNEFKKWLGE